jgi:hypothetical protein
MSGLQILLTSRSYAKTFKYLGRYRLYNRASPAKTRCKNKRLQVNAALTAKRISLVTRPWTIL